MKSIKERSLESKILQRLQNNEICTKLVNYLFADEGRLVDSVYLIYILLGVFFLFVGCLFKMGVHIREEQELTI